MIYRHLIISLWALTPLNTDLPVWEQFPSLTPGLVLLSLVTEPPRVMGPPCQFSLSVLITFTLPLVEGNSPFPRALLSSLCYNINLCLCSLLGKDFIFDFQEFGLEVKESD